MALHRRPLFGALLLILAALCLGPAVARTLAAPLSAVPAPLACAELIQNGGFETNAAWQLGSSPVPPQYVASGQHTGSRALQLGVIGGPNVFSFSSVRQTVTIPANATQAQLSFWFYAVATGAPGTDYMEATLLSADGYSVLHRLWYSESDSRAWNPQSFDLMPWRGQTVQVYFNVFNDGTGGTAGMLLDDVSLVACTDGSTGTPTNTPNVIYVTPTPTNTPNVVYVTPTSTNTPYVVYVTPTSTATPVYALVTPTPTATPIYVLVTPTGTATGTASPVYVLVTPTSTTTPVYALVTPTGTATQPAPVPVPTNCMDLLVNGNFEAGTSGWWVAPDKLQAQLETTRVHGGIYGMLLGTNTNNIYSYSSIRQQVTLPYGYSQLTLDFWTWTWAENPGGTDHQEAVLLEPDPSIIQKVWRGLYNEQNWVERTIPLIQYAGRTVVVYFNVVNDGAGGRSGMYLDDVHLWACGQYGGNQPISGGPAPTMPPPISGGQPVQPIVVTQIVVVQVQVPATPTVPILPPNVGPGTGTPVVNAPGTGPTINALDRTSTPVPTASPTAGALILPTVTPAPSWFSQFLASVRANLPGPWIVGMIIVVLAILGVIWLLTTRSNGIPPP